MTKKLVHYRISEEIDEAIFEISRREKITKTEFLEKALKDLITKYFGDNPDVLKKERDKFERARNRQKRRELRRENTELTHCLYLAKNLRNRIIDVGASSWVNTGEINIKPIKFLINNAKKEFDLMPNEIQDMLREEMGIICYRADKKRIYELVGNAAKMKYLESKRRQTKSDS